MAEEKSIKAKEMRERSLAELQSLLMGKTEELQRVSFKHALGQLRETSEVSRLKKDIARLNTVIREQQAASA